MWRALFLATGITLILLGGQLFFVEQLEIMRVRKKPKPAVVNPYDNNQPFQQVGFQQPVIQPPQSPTILYTPKDWMPWSLLAVGSVIVIYTFTIPGRRRRKEE